MSEEAIKEQMRDTVKSIAEYYRRTGLFQVIILTDPNCPFQIELVRKHEEKGDEIIKLMVLLDWPTDEDIRRCENYLLPKKMFTKAFSVKKKNKQIPEYIPLERMSSGNTLHLND